jgi:hypothetical protein
MRHTFKFSGVTFYVYATEDEDAFGFEYAIDGKAIRSKTRTKLLGLAVRRVQLRIRRELNARNKLKARNSMPSAAG